MKTLQDVQVERLSAFAREILEDTYEGRDLSGGDVQEIALKYGLIREETMKEPCGDSCVCAEVTTFPTPCYRYTNLVYQDKDLQSNSESANINAT